MFCFGTDFYKKVYTWVTHCESSKSVSILFSTQQNKFAKS